MITLHIETKRPKEVVDVTERVQLAIQQHGLSNGVIILFLPHTTAALTTADLEPGGDQDLLEAFEVIIPKLAYKRVRNLEQAANYIMSAIIDPSLTLPVQEGRLKLGIRQRLVLIELNGPRDREVTLTFLTSG